MDALAYPEPARPSGQVGAEAEAVLCKHSFVVLVRSHSALSASRPSYASVRVLVTKHPSKARSSACCGPLSAATSGIQRHLRWPGQWPGEIADRRIALFKAARRTGHVASQAECRRFEPDRTLHSICRSLHLVAARCRYGLRLWAIAFAKV
jgi:hypothetical protein